jgi:hypothetical protein
MKKDEKKKSEPKKGPRTLNPADLTVVVGGSKGDGKEIGTVPH